MNVLMFAMLVLAGVLADWLAGLLMERGGYGLRWDVTLGLAGSAIAIVAQRKIWPTTSMEHDAGEGRLHQKAGLGDHAR